jgi:LPS export ABC transporter protein LptC/lipopolysaccharide transport protein LptA
MRWQRPARVIVAVSAIGFAIAVGLTLRSRTAPAIEAPLTKTDPKALVESAGGLTFRVNKDREDIRIKYDKLLSYENGSSKMLGVTVTTERAGGRVFIIRGREGEVADKETNVSLVGDVQISASDGMELRAERATYTEADGTVRAPGPVQFARARMNGSGVGFTYDKNQNVLTIADQAAVHMAPDDAGAGSMDVVSGSLIFQRNEKLLHFDRTMKAVREGEVIEADAAVAHLSPDEQRLEAVELRGHSRITGTKGAAGGLRSLSGGDIDLRYAADGLAIEHALINGEAAILLAGDAGQAGRQISADTLDVSMGSDGATPVALTGRGHARVVIPPDGQVAGRIISAQAIDSRGDDAHGLTSARFTGEVQFAERGATVNREARSAVLDVGLAPGFGALQEARFAQGVRFVDGETAATAAAARYVLDKGVLELSGSEPATRTPHLVTSQLTVDATKIDLTLAGPDVKAAGTVKSVLQPKPPPPAGDAAAAAPGTGSDGRMPSMLKQDQPVNVTAEQLAYDGSDQRAVYTGSAQLWQGDTTIKGSAITIDSRTGDLAAAGPVATTSVMVQEKSDGTRERVRSIGSARTFGYEDANRKATYDGDAHMSGPQGDTVAGRIELFLKPSGDEMERAEAYEAVTLRDRNRKTTGNRLSYRSADESYVVAGTPVLVVDACGRETVGRTLTFFQNTDRIIVDGNAQVRTQSKGKSNCP